MVIWRYLDSNHNWQAAASLLSIVSRMSLAIQLPSSKERRSNERKCKLALHPRQVSNHLGIVSSSDLFGWTRTMIKCYSSTLNPSMSALSRVWLEIGLVSVFCVMKIFRQTRIYTTSCTGGWRLDPHYLILIASHDLSVFDASYAIFLRWRTHISVRWHPPTLINLSTSSPLLSLISFNLQGFIPRELVANEVHWFYSFLGIDDNYFAAETVEVISDHIIALFGAKILAYTKHDPSQLVIDLEKIDEDGKGATFIHTSSPGKTTTEGPGSVVESRIDALYLDKSTPQNAYRLETYRSQGSISVTASQQLRCYFVTKCNFPSKPPSSTRTDGYVSLRSLMVHDLIVSWVLEKPISGSSRTPFSLRKLVRIP